MNIMIKYDEGQLATVRDGRTGNRILDCLPPGQERAVRRLSVSPPRERRLVSRRDMPDSLWLASMIGIED
jgi:hypothetical protein